MRVRSEGLTREDGPWAGLALDVRDDRPRPGLCVYSGPGRRLMLAQGSRPVLLAVVVGPRLARSLRDLRFDKQPTWA
ncbi:hypothetical protein ACF1E9_15855 [Streptomyces roseolus]|uniref:hypothetical protein n=1 Tax=Streptomyces TaxID=1883 RepID=UPI0036EA8E18